MDRGLEKSLQAEVSRLIVAHEAAEPAVSSGPLRDKLSALDRLTGGQLLSRLRGLGVPEQLDKRIGAVIARRNRLVHHMMEDASFVRAFGGGEPLAATVQSLERLAIEAAELAVELHMFAAPKLTAMVGLSHSQIAALVANLDPAAIADGRERRQLEALQAFADMTDLTAVLDEMLDDSTAK